MAIQLKNECRVFLNAISLYKHSRMITTKVWVILRTIEFPATQMKKNGDCYSPIFEGHVSLDLPKQHHLWGFYSMNFRGCRLSYSLMQHMFFTLQLLSRSPKIQSTFKSHGCKPGMTSSSRNHNQSRRHHPSCPVWEDVLMLHLFDFCTTKLYCCWCTLGTPTTISRWYFCFGMCHLESMYHTCTHIDDRYKSTKWIDK